MTIKSMRRALAGFETRPFNVLANLASILGLVVALFAEFKIDSSSIVLLYLCGLSLFLILRYVRQERWARYAEGNRLLAKAIERVKDVTDRRLYGTLGRVDAIESLQESLASFAQAFSLVTGTDCRATIKEIYTDEILVNHPKTGIDVGTDLFVATLVRSDTEESRRVDQEDPDLVSQNSDFKQVVTSVKPFHGPNLPKAWMDRTYTNSHWPDELRQSQDFPYRSAIVWPIGIERLAPARRRGTQEGEEAAVIAVLCIDSKRTHAFRPGADLQFGYLYAHSLYPLLRYDRDDA